MRFREHRGGLNESMVTAVEIEGTSQGLRDKLVEVLSEIHDEQFASGLLANGVLLIHHGMDARIGWDTYMVTSQQTGVLGFIDGVPIEDSTVLEIGIVGRESDPGHSPAYCHANGYSVP